MLVEPPLLHQDECNVGTETPLPQTDLKINKANRKKTLISAEIKLSNYANHYNF